MPEPVHIAAIDAGSNAVRLSIARAYSALDIEPLVNERFPLRLGEGVFVRHRFSEEILKKAVKAFRHLHEVMEEYGVTKYRAVATSASREAHNSGTLVRRVKQATGLRLEVITAKEESRLGREAATAALGPESPPNCVVDLGGGSLEINILRDHSILQSAQLPIGTVRLMTTLGIPGVIRPAQAEQVRRYVRALLESRIPNRPNLADQLSVALGGNAETLSNVAPGPRREGLPTLDVSLLRERLPDILERDLRERMKSYGVRRDRADVMGVAAIIFVVLGRYLNIRQFLIPTVGIREGILQEIARDAFSRKEPHRYNTESRQILIGAPPSTSANCASCSSITSNRCIICRRKPASSSKQVRSFTTSAIASPIVATTNTANISPSTATSPASTAATATSSPLSFAITIASPLLTTITPPIPRSTTAKSASSAASPPSSALQRLSTTPIASESRISAPPSSVAP